jgi:hypothetical protein
VTAGGQAECLPAVTDRPGRGWWPAVAAVALAVLVPVLAALRWAGYSHRTQYISELGARAAPDGALVSAGFVLIGVLLLAFTAWFALRSRASGLLLVAVLMVGGAVGSSYAVSGVARCDPGCPDVDASAEQLVHNLTGTAGYTVAIAGVALFGLAGRRDERWGAVARASLVAAPVMLVAALAIPVAGEWRGLLQRIVEVGQMGFLLVVALTARSVPAPAPAR